MQGFAGVAGKLPNMEREARSRQSLDAAHFLGAHFPSLSDDVTGVVAVHDGFLVCCDTKSHDCNVITFFENNNEQPWNNIDEKYSIMERWIVLAR